MSHKGSIPDKLAMGHMHIWYKKKKKKKKTAAQENNNLSKIDRKEKKGNRKETNYWKNNKFSLKRLQMFHIIWAKVSNFSNVHKMLRRQTNVYVTTMSVLLFQAYCKHNIRLKIEES